MPFVEEVLKGAGRFELPLKRNAELEAVIDERDFLHIEIRWGSELFQTLVLHGGRPQRGAYVLTGQLLPWWLGVENESSPDIARLLRYPSGKSKLSNGNLELGELYWSTREGSAWVIDENDPIEGKFSARVATNPGAEIDELRPIDISECLPGDEFRLPVDYRRDSGIVGRVRPRIYFGGRFDPPNEITPNADFSDGETGWDFSPDEFAVVDGVLRCKSIQKRPLINGNFESGDLTGWNPDPADATFAVSSSSPITGTYSLVVDLAESDGNRNIGSDLMSTNPGDRWRVQFRALPIDDPTADLLYRVFAEGPDLDQEFTHIDELGADPHTHVIDERTGFGEHDGNERHIQREFTTPEGADQLELNFGFHSTGDIGLWKVDSCALTRLEGNTARLARLATFPVIAGRTYKITNLDFFDKPKGSFWWQLRCSATGRPDVILRTTEQGPKDADEAGVLHQYEGSVTIPSGYDTAKLELVVKDVFGGYLWMSYPKVADADTGTRVFETETPASGEGTVELVATAPAGTETVTAALFAEIDSQGFVVDNAELVWTAAPTEAADVVRDAIEGTGLSEGEIHDAGTIGFDRFYHNSTRRQILDDISGIGLVSPAREWDITPDGLVHWGLPEEIFSDREDFILSAEDVFLADEPSTETDDGERVGVVRVLGAERQTLRGDRIVITGEAETAINAEMYDGSTFRREKLIEDSSVDHAEFAAQLAQQVASQLSGKRRSHTFNVRDWKVLGKATGYGYGFKVGDWIQLESPENGIEDPSNLKEFQGRTIFPERVRVRSRTTHLGSGPWKVYLRLGPGPDDLKNITDLVLFEKQTRAQVEVGDPYPSFVTDPQAGGVAKQFIRFRAATRTP